MSGKPKGSGVPRQPAAKSKKGPKEVPTPSSPSPPKKAEPEEPFPCPCCDHFFMGISSRDGHLKKHVSGALKPSWPDSAERSNWLAANGRAVCCGTLVGNMKQGKSKGKCKKCKNKIKDNIFNKKEEEKKESKKEGKGKEKEKEKIVQVFPTASLNLPPSPFPMSYEDSILFANTIPISKLLPEKALPIVAQALAAAFESILRDPDNMRSWIPLAVVIPFLFVDDVKRRDKGDKGRSEGVITRARLFISGEWDLLIEEVKEKVAQGKEKRRDKAPEKESEDDEIRRGLRLIKNGETDKFLRSKMSDGLANLKDKANVEELRSKFPEGERIDLDPRTFVKPEAFSEDKVMKAVKRLAQRKRSAGVSQLSAELLFRIFRFSPHLLDMYTTVINKLAAAEVEDALFENLMVRGVALRKVPKGIRPLGIPEVHSGVVTSLLLASKKEVLRDAFEPVQQALTPGGTENIVHAIRFNAEVHQNDPNRVLLLLDFMNAFNELDRKTFMLQLFELVPEFAPYLYAEYHRAKTVVYPDGVKVKAQKGSIQGCGMGVITCCAAEKKMLEELKVLLESGDLLAALMDDISVITTQEIAIKVVNFVKAEGPKYGLILNMPKTIALFICAIEGKVKHAPVLKEWPEGIKIITGGGVEIGGKEDGARSLGSFIGPAKYTTSEILKRIDTKAKPLFEVAVSMRHCYAAWEIIKRIPAITGLDYIFRTTPPHLTAPACDYFDSLLRNAFERGVVGAHMKEEEWQMAQLPFPVGWNLTPSKVKALAAYTASLNSHRDEIIRLSPGSKSQIDSTLKRLEEQINAPVTLTPSTRQRDITQAMLKKLAVHFAEHPDLRTRALYKSQSDPHATSYKSSPVRPGLFHESDLFQVIARRSLGMDLVTEPLQCPGCRAALDTKGDHECPQMAAWVRKHNAIRNLSSEIAREGFIETSLEVTKYLKPECRACQATLLSPTQPHDCTKPDAKNREPLKTTYDADQIVYNGVVGLTLRETLVDFTVKNEFLPTYLDLAAERLGAAAEKGEKEKNDDYKRRVEKINCDFLAISCDSMGYLRPQGVTFFNYFIAQRAIHKGMTFNESAALFWHKWSFTIHRENARNILLRYKIISNLATRNSSL